MPFSTLRRRARAGLVLLALLGVPAAPAVLAAESVPGKSVDEQFAQLMKEQGDMRLFNEVAVLGEVNAGGKLKIGAFSRITLVEVIAKSGGTKKGADLRAVRIFRLNPDGVNETYTEDLTPRPDGKKVKFRMQPGDIVWVPVEK